MKGMQAEATRFEGHLMGVMEKVATILHSKRVEVLGYIIHEKRRDGLSGKTPSQEDRGR